MEMEELHNRIIYLMSVSDKSLRKAVKTKVFEHLFDEDDVAALIVREFISWFKKYDSVPSMQRIFETYKDTPWGAKLRIRFKTIVSISESEKPPTENEFESYLNELKIVYGKNKFTQKLASFSEQDNKNMIKDIGTFSEFVKDFGKGFIEIGTTLDSHEEGEYSFTTMSAKENIENIIGRDLSNEKRFNIGHQTIDEATKGFKYGDLLMILGNINQGKSMVLVNIAYNLWREGHNVLLLTAEMRPEHFDERIYSRASAVDYTSIMSGKQFLTGEDRAALEECVKEIGRRKNHIITKFLQPTDNVATVEGYLNDLKLRSGFVPDVIIFDSLEHISPLYVPAEEKDWQLKGQVITEFKTWAETCLEGRGVFVISTHQAKTETNDKKFEDIAITDFGRSKIVPEKADYAIYIRTLSELKLLNVKLIKARRCQVGLSWSMATDYSKCLITNTVDSTNSQALLLQDE
jgi:archaellum biogenesis ATPase FlaH